ncbi:hypothetical protein ACH4UY_37530 [Streptomyces longwoodensis]|uniref:hypothetical protein n=1 Tax=Streptomyces longwoodensis TaxID=68231 RepID=UPI0037B320F3
MENAVPHWAILKASGPPDLFGYSVYRELEGTEAEALAVMLELVDTFAEARTEAGHRRQRRQVFRLNERSYFIRVHNRVAAIEEAHFILAPLIADTSNDQLPDIAGQSV